MPVVQLPALQDNYVHLLLAREGQECLVIDPADSETVIQYCEKAELTPHAILCTHHHHDHVGGNLALQKKYHCPIFGSEYDRTRIPGLTQTVHDQELLHLIGFSIKVLFCPGHTLGAVTYLIEGSPPLAFTGDTLFSMGCGRLFEGSPQQMWASLQYLKAKVPPSTLIYCGHEYTYTNTAFARSLERSPGEELESLWAGVQKARREGRSTVPSLFSDEMALNPFLKASTPEEFARIRGLRNEFRLEP